MRALFGGQLRSMMEEEFQQRYKDKKATQEGG